MEAPLLAPYFVGFRDLWATTLRGGSAFLDSGPAEPDASVQAAVALLRDLTRGLDGLQPPTDMLATHEDLRSLLVSTIAILEKDGPEILAGDSPNLDDALAVGLIKMSQAVEMVRQVARTNGVQIPADDAAGPAGYHALPRRPLG